jgi:hypothetical protein
VWGQKPLSEVAFVRLTRHTVSMGKKHDIIRQALNHKGVCVTSGIPEHIIELLGLHGYKIKKRKKVKPWK